MDKIWDRNPSKPEVIGRSGGDEKAIDHTEPTKVIQQPHSHSGIHKNIYN